MERFDKLVINSAQNGCSDLHIVSGHPLVYRKDGEILFDNENRWSNQHIKELVDYLMGPHENEILKNRLSVEFARTINHIRLRINVFYNNNGLGLAIRLLPPTPPNIKNLNLHPAFIDYCKIKSGLIIICGPTGCGKSTTIAAMIEQINLTRSAHIISLEDPIEYKYRSNKSLIVQRELGCHINSYEQGLLDVLREDPDVIVVGELRESETMRLTLHAAESGHLVIASLHASNPEDAIFRICNSFHDIAQDSVRNQLAGVIKVLVVQKLLYSKKLKFRIPLLSIMIGNASIRSLIRDSKFAQIENTIQTSYNEGMYTMERYSQYLNSRVDFIHPSVNFRPAYEAIAKDNNKDKNIKSTRPSLPNKSKIKNLVKKAIHIGKAYEIDEDSSLDGIIKEMEDKGMYKQ